VQGLGTLSNVAFVANLSMQVWVTLLLACTDVCGCLVDKLTCAACTDSCTVRVCVPVLRWGCGTQWQQHGHVGVLCSGLGHVGCRNQLLHTILLRVRVRAAAAFRLRCQAQTAIWSEKEAGQQA
jgi:hypothetical protein